MNMLPSAMVTICCLSAGLVFGDEPRFKPHIIRESPAWVTSVHQVALSDLDGDGDLDWTVGNVHKNPNLYWYEYQGSDQWIDHFHTLAVIDYDHDGDWDVLTAVGPLAKVRHRTYLYENLSGRGKKPAQWKRHVILADHPCHEALAGDVDRDGDIDLVIKGWTSGSFLYLENDRTSTAR